MEQAIQRLLEAVDTIMSAPGSWSEKRAKIIEMAHNHDSTNLDEFIGWFEEGDLE